MALSAAGHLAADWQNYGVTFNGDLAGSGVFTQVFVNAPFQYTLLGGVFINIQGGMPTAYQIAINRDPGFNGPVSISFPPLPSGVTYDVSPDNPNASAEVLTVTFHSHDAVPSAYLPAVLQVNHHPVPRGPELVGLRWGHSARRMGRKSGDSPPRGRSEIPDAWTPRVTASARPAVRPGARAGRTATAASAGASCSRSSPAHRC